MYNVLIHLVNKTLTSFKDIKNCKTKPKKKKNASATRRLRVIK